VIRSGTEIGEIADELRCRVSVRSERFGSTSPQEKRETGLDDAPGHWTALATQPDESNRDLPSFSHCALRCQSRLNQR
jgi:hypothetical protein